VTVPEVAQKEVLYCEVVPSLAVARATLSALIMMKSFTRLSFCFAYSWNAKPESCIAC
jgi:hypothetical protein